MRLDIGLFDEHHLPLYRFAWRLTGSVADAEDIVQECFLELLRPGCNYDPARTSIRTYLFGIVRNQCLKRLRTRQPLELSGGPANHSPEAAILQGELESAVSRAITDLPETQKEVLILAHYEELPHAEIAQILNIEVAAVKSRLQRARAGLKETLATYAGHVGGKR